MSGIVVLRFIDLLLSPRGARRNFIITIKSTMKHKQEYSSSQTGFSAMITFLKTTGEHCSRFHRGVGMCNK